MTTTAKRRFPREALRWGLGLAVLLGARASLADHYVVPTGSMEPTVVPGDHVCVEKAAYGLRVPFSESWALRWRDPARGDVVVLRSPETGEVLLKRVVALAGDEVAVKDGRITLGGEPVAVRAVDGGVVEDLGAPHRLGTTYGGGPDFGPVRVPAGTVLVLGDSRGNSHDGRSFGFVQTASIMGRAAGVCLRDHAPTWQPL
jgi:signal peptidase I